MNTMKKLGQKMKANMTGEMMTGDVRPCENSPLLCCFLGRLLV